MLGDSLRRTDVRLKSTSGEFVIEVALKPARSYMNETIQLPKEHKLVEGTMYGGDGARFATFDLITGERTGSNHHLDAVTFNPSTNIIDVKTYGWLITFDKAIITYKI